MAGYYQLPVKCLEAPSEGRLVRECSKTIVDNLKEEMLANSCNDVQPILCIVKLEDSEVFNINTKEGYKYETVGGNHSRQAIQELLNEKPDLQNRRHFTHPLCSVYRPMDNKLIRRMASQHNRATAYCHEMTTWDLVRIIEALYVYYIESTINTSNIAFCIC